MIGRTRILFHSFQQLPRLFLKTLEKQFELTRCPSRAISLPHALLQELQRYMNAVRCAVVGAKVLGHSKKQKVLPSY